MKYRTIILLSFVLGCLLSLAILIIIREQQPQPIRPHPGDDMVGVAYGLSVGFNVVLAIGSLPSLLVTGKAKNKIWLNILSLLGLPLAFTMYTTMALDAYALLYCIPYLLAATLLFMNRIRKARS